MASVAAVDDSTLESMTAALLQVSSVFLIQQNELQEVRDRMNKELARVTLIQEALVTAAQQHQEAVLNVIQNYESLATEHPSAASSRLSAASVDSSVGGPPGASTRDSAARQSRRKSMRTVHLPPVASELQVFHQAPEPPKSPSADDDDDDDGGIKYVEKLQVC